MKRPTILSSALAALTLMFALVVPTMAQVSAPESNRIDQLRLDAPVETANPRSVLSPGLAGATGRVQVVVRMRENPAATVAQGSQLAQGAVVGAQQDRVVARIRALDPSAVEYARLRIGLNAVIMEVDAQILPSLARDTEIARINKVLNYERDAQPPMETVPYIGATPSVQNSAFRGKDVRVAVLDSGIDYTHAAFGGPGTAAAYEAAYGISTADPRNTTLDGLFPTARVKGGYDFVGEVWPNGPLAPDPDPIDLEGHGTHVADIIGGEQGVAPEVDLYAVKVCSAVSTSCSGVAILQGLEWAADPNGDGMTDDHMHIVNMSLGSSYGQNYDDDSSILVDNIAPVGVLVVASAGNSADRPYIVGTPSAARSALSVAQTTVPSDQVFTVQIGGLTIGLVAQPWAPLPAGIISAPLAYDATNSGTRLGCTNAAGASPWVGTPLAGRVVLVDRGTCAVSLKVSNAQAAGAIAVLVANNAAGDVPPVFSFGGGTVTVPAFTTTLASGSQLKARVGQTATIDPSSGSNIVGSAVASSSRGPAVGQMFYGNQTMYGQIIKPEIGAPGASISAIAGSGTEVEPFGGTSGAAPMVSGAAALLFNASNWSMSPWELKSRLMNTAETNILNKPAIFGGGLTPITRIGGGEVRIDRAIAAKASAWESVSRGGAISFGMIDVTKNPTTLRRTVVVRNYGNTPLTYNIVPGFRFADDAATGAVTPNAPASITVPARSQRSFVLSLTVDPTKLQPWTLNSGSQGGNGDALTIPEYDGYLTLDTAGTTNDLTMPWHILPRAAGNVSAPGSVKLSGGSADIKLTNNGANAADVETFALIGSNPFVTASPGAGLGLPPMDLRYVGVSTIPDFCDPNDPLIQIAVNTHQRITHANYPVSIQVDFDTNNDGTPDYSGFTSELGTFASSGQNLFFVGPFGSGSGSAFFYTAHQTNSANTILLLCGSQIGNAQVGQQIGVSAYVYDNYFFGSELSKIEGMNTVLGAPRYTDSVGFDTVPAGGSLPMTISSTGSTAATTERGILMLLSYGPNGNEARAVTVR